MRISDELIAAAKKAVANVNADVTCVPIDGMDGFVVQGERCDTGLFQVPIIVDGITYWICENCKKGGTNM